MKLWGWIEARYCLLNQRARQHNVNPTLFIVIYLFSFLPYYFGIYLMLKASGLLAVSWGDLVRFEFGGLCPDNALMIGGLCLNRLAWAMPYLYIEVVGKGLRWYVHLAIWTWISGSIAYLIYFKLH